MAEDERAPLTTKELNEMAAIARKWAAERKMDLIMSINSLGLVRSSKLLNSVKSGVRLKAGEIQSIYFKYEWYGLFHDKGAVNVGRGKVNLPARHWMAPKVYGAKLDELLESLSEYYAELTINAMKLDINTEKA
jgi:hypothetical protein